MLNLLEMMNTIHTGSRFSDEFYSEVLFHSMLTKVIESDHPHKMYHGDEVSRRIKIKIYTILVVLQVDHPLSCSIVLMKNADGSIVARCMEAKRQHIDLQASYRDRYDQMEDSCQ